MGERFKHRAIERWLSELRHKEARDVEERLQMMSEAKLHALNEDLKLRLQERDAQVHALIHPRGIEAWAEAVAQARNMTVYAQQKGESKVFEARPEGDSFVVAPVDPSKPTETCGGPGENAELAEALSRAGHNEQDIADMIAGRKPLDLVGPKPRADETTQELMAELGEKLEADIAETDAVLQRYPWLTEVDTERRIAVVKPMRFLDRAFEMFTFARHRRLCDEIFGDSVELIQRQVKRGCTPRRVYGLALFAVALVLWNIGRTYLSSPEKSKRSSGE